VSRLLDDPAAYAAMVSSGKDLYGDGQSARRIVDLLS